MAFLVRIRFSLLVLPVLLVLSACNMPTGTEQISPTATSTSAPSPTLTPSLTSTDTPAPTPTETSTLTPTSSSTATGTLTPTQTKTPTETQTPTETLTPTEEAVTVLAEQNVNCRWGPATVYLYAGLLAKGQTAKVDGRNYPATWLWIKWEGMSYHCWVAASAVTLTGDVQSVLLVPTDPPVNYDVPSPANVQASRSKNKVTITWNPSPPAVGLHYLIQAQTCNGQFVIEWVDTTTNTSYSLQDQKTCSDASSAKVYTVTKLGYSSPVTVPWP